jgi:hypothetical protein
MRMSRRGFTYADINGDASCPQPRMTAARHQRIGILRCRHNAADAGGNHGVGAGRTSAKVGTWLQRYVEGSALRRFAGLSQGLYLGMRPPARLRPAAADNGHGIAHIVCDQSPYGGIRPGSTLPPTSQRQRKFHKPRICVGCCGRNNVRLITVQKRMKSHSHRTLIRTDDPRLAIEESDMMTKRTAVRTIGPFRALLILAGIVASTQTAGAFEISARQRAICTPDAMRFCSSALSDKMALASCMLRAKPQLGGACRSVVSSLQRQYAQSN